MRLLRQFRTFYFFFYEEILHTKKAHKTNKRLSTQIFYTPKNIKQGTFTHTKHNANK